MNTTSIKKEKCGCKTKTEQYILNDPTIYPNLQYPRPPVTIQTKTKCNKHQKEDQIKNQIKELKTKQDLIERLKESSTKLFCEICKRLIGYVEENDLQGSHFICIECKQ